MNKEHQEAIDALANNAAMSVKEPESAEIVRDSIKNGLAVDPMPTSIVGEYKNAIASLKPSALKMLLKEVAGPIVGIRAENVSNAHCGNLHPDPLAVDPAYAALRDEEQDCLPKNPSTYS